MTSHNLFIQNGFFSIPIASDSVGTPSREVLATVLSNMAYYGYTANKAGVESLSRLDDASLTYFWSQIEPAFKSVTGDDRKMADAMVYKNFPAEALSLDESTRLLQQILIYSGIPYDLLREEENERPPLGDMSTLKVLALADDDTPSKIFENLMVMSNRWSDNQYEWAKELLGNRNVILIDSFGFKENGIKLAAENFEAIEVTTSTATDVLRLAAALSDSDISLRGKVTFRRFGRSLRRRLITMMEAAKNIEDDFASRPEQFKRLLQFLRPGDYKAPKVSAAYDNLYNKKVKSFAAKVDPQEYTDETLETVVTRPGEFLRRFHHYYGVYDVRAVDAFIGVMDKLNTRQLVNFRGYLGTINTRSSLIYAPKSNWTRAQVSSNKKKKIADEHITAINDKISEILSARLSEKFPEGIDLSPDVAKIKLQTNDQKLAEYGRGTIFDIPADKNYLRSASFWEHSTSGTWFDNGWNFFDAEWKSQGGLSWTNQNFQNGAAIFSGDPINSAHTGNKGCQMIDLYIDKLLKAGVRYAVWNVLCYSNIAFSEAKEVLATLQMGDDADAGAVYEPSRAQMVFPLKSEAKTSYVAYVDLLERRIVYMDAPLRGTVSDACQNGDTLSSLMPAYVEYLDALPSVYDLMRDAPKGTMPVLFSDADQEITAEKAFVFSPEKAENDYTRVTVTDLIAAAD